MSSKLSLTVALPPTATGGTWVLKADAPYAVAGSNGVVTGFRGDISSTGVLTAKGGGPALVEVPASGGYDAGMGVLTCTFLTPTATVLGQPIRIPLVETGSGDMDVAYLINTGRGQILTPQQAVDFNTLLASGTSTLAELQQATVSATAVVTGAAAADSALRAIANSTPYAAFEAFPPASTASGKAAIALDTGAIYRSNGTSWGSPIGTVITQAQAVGETYADALPVSLPVAVTAYPRLRLAPRTYPLPARLVQSGSVVAPGATLAPTSGLATPEAVRLSSGAEVIGGTLDGSTMPAPTADWLGGVVPPGTAYAAEGASSAARVSGLRVDTTVSNVPQAAFYGTQIKDARVKVAGVNIGTASAAHDIAAAVVVSDASDVHVDLQVDGLGMKGVSMTRVQGGSMTGRVVNGNSGHAAFFQRLGSGVRAYNLYVRNGFGYKCDGGADSSLIGGTFETANVMLQGGTRNLILGIKSIEALGAAIHAGYHPTNLAALIDCTISSSSVYRSSGLNSADNSQDGLLVDAGAGSLPVDGLKVRDFEVDGGYNGIRQLNRTGGQLLNIDWSNLQFRNLTQTIIASPLSGSIRGLRAASVTRGVTITAQTGAPAGGVLTLSNWDVAQTGATTADLGLSIVSGVALDHLIIDGLRISGGYRAIGLVVGVDGSNAPLIKRITLRNLRATGGSSGTSVSLTVSGSATSNVILELEGNYSDKAILLSGAAWTVAKDVSNTFSAKNGFPVVASAPIYTGLLPTSGAAWTLGQYLTNTAPSSGTWSSLTIALAGISGTPNATITTTSGSATATVNQIGNLAVGQRIASSGVLPTRTITAINGTTLTLNATANVTGTGALEFVDKATYYGAGWIGVVAKASLPAAATYPNSLAVISDPAAGKSRTVISDGTAWRYTGDDSLV